LPPVWSGVGGTNGTDRRDKVQLASVEDSLSRLPATIMAQEMAILGDLEKRLREHAAN